MKTAEIITFYQDVLMFPHGRHMRSPTEGKKSSTEDKRTEKALGTRPFEKKLKPDPNRAKRHRTPPRVEIHNIRSALPEPEIEVLYTVYQGKYSH